MKYKVAYFALWAAMPFLFYWAIQVRDMTLCLACVITLGFLTTTNWRFL